MCGYLSITCLRNDTEMELDTKDRDSHNRTRRIIFPEMSSSLIHQLSCGINHVLLLLISRDMFTGLDLKLHKPSPEKSTFYLFYFNLKINWFVVGNQFESKAEAEKGGKQLPCTVCTTFQTIGVKVLESAKVQ